MVAAELPNMRRGARTDSPSADLPQVSVLGIAASDRPNHAIVSDREHEIRMARIALPEKTPCRPAAHSDHLNIPAANGDGEFNGLGPGRQSLIGHCGLLIRIVTAKAYWIVELSNPQVIVRGYHFRALNSALQALGHNLSERSPKPRAQLAVWPALHWRRRAQ
jgi:hypothetical protein